MKFLLLSLSSLFLFTTLLHTVTTVALALNRPTIQLATPCPRPKPVNFFSKSNIYYAADNTITLFINCVQKGPTITSWPTTTHIDHSLAKGDVVAFEVEDFHVWYGMIASVNFGGWSSTGLDNEWRAIRADDYVGPPDAWKKPSYNACSWPSVQTRAATIGVTPGTSAAYPTALGAKYVWAKGVGGVEKIYVRRVVGCCCPRKPRQNVHYAADKRVTMFVNGVLIPPTVTSWPTTTSKYVPLTYGDVVAFEVTDFGVWYGLAAAINVDGWSSTGADVEWRAIAASAYMDDPDAWKLPSYDPCAWPSVAVRPGTVNGITSGTSPTFPYPATGATYVWAAGAVGRQTIYVRRVVGGICKKPTKRWCYGKPIFSQERA